MDPRRQSTVVGTTRLDPSAGPADRLLCERLHEADGLTLVRATLLGASRWNWQAFESATAYGYVAAGRITLDSHDGAGSDRSVPERDAITLDADSFFQVPPGRSPTVHRAGESGPAELLVGFETDPTGSVVAGDGGTTDSAGPQTAAPIRVAEPSDLVSASELAEVSRETPFPDASVRMVRGHSDGEVVSEWHHHGDNHVFGYVLAGDGFVEWGTGEDDRKLVEVDECFHIPAEFVHRDRSSSDGRQEYVLWLTGSEPRTVHVDGPTLGE